MDKVNRIYYYRPPIAEAYYSSSGKREEFRPSAKELNYILRSDGKHIEKLCEVIVKKGVGKGLEQEDAKSCIKSSSKLYGVVNVDSNLVYCIFRYLYYWK